MACQTKYCKNKTRGVRKLCSSCSFRKWKEKNPEKYCYNNLKQNSKRRKKSFTLTFDQFLQFCKKTDYLVGKGKKKESYSIDRIDPNKGYDLDNIQVLTLSSNSRKGTKSLSYDWQTKYATVIDHSIRPKFDDDEDLPF